MENDILKEQIANAVGGGGVAAIGVNQDGTPYNAGGNPSNKFGEPPVFRKGISLLKRPSLLPNASKKKPLRNILDPMSTIGGK
jgi:hypothetical protein